ncbi:hypothetical protein [Sphingomonas sp. ABOLE]|uniref:hypothetical protein n=1 Tax=Sphingomonas sp. ABOLE TaxID=1985878 RepID=UPI001F493E82|nr:hypothetical protein [Sphingomonas sp. ABOLE]
MNTGPIAAYRMPGSGALVARPLAPPRVRPPARAALVRLPTRRASPHPAADERRPRLSILAPDAVLPSPTSETQGAGAASAPEAVQAFPGQRLDPPAGAGPRRWSGSAWFALRPGQGIGAAPAAGQLGGSQYGVRVVRALDRRGRLAAVGRIAGPLRGQGAEVALGFEWRPAGIPVRIAVEERFGLDGIQGGPGLGAVAGLYRERAAFRLEAYGQAGAILRVRLEPYADGALRLTRTIAAGRATALAVGIGSWGAAQRGVQRLDIGPTLVTSVPIGALQTRIALDWRQRIAGNARPGSGVALTLGSDF